jgi:hypothetical protein
VSLFYDIFSDFFSDFSSIHNDKKIKIPQLFPLESFATRLAIVSAPEHPFFTSGDQITPQFNLSASLAHSIHHLKSISNHPVPSEDIEIN